MKWIEHIPQHSHLAETVKKGTRALNMFIHRVPPISFYTNLY